MYTVLENHIKMSHLTFRANRATFACILLEQKMLENAKIQKLNNSNETFLVFTKQCTVIENQQNIFCENDFFIWLSNNVYHTNAMKWNGESWIQIG